MNNLPEILFASSSEAESRRLSKLQRDGIIIKLVPRVYTSNLNDSSSIIILRNWQMMLAHLYPGSLISHRSALEFMPTDKQNIYITYNSRKVISWPGLTIRMIRGPGPLKDDHSIYGHLHASSFERACLENLTPSRISEGEPYDAARMTIFSTLIAFLKQCSFEQRIEKKSNTSAFQHMAFIESYFSNYIEGTRFIVEDAEEIVFQNKIIENGTGDSHDIRGTYEICGSKHEMGTIPSTEENLIQLLRSRHSTLLKGHPDKNPGAFKHQPNRTGESIFVLPKMVIGTLKHGFRLMGALTDPLSRALYMMFLISEVHPFEDGNGRIARIMMNAELASKGYTKLIIPTVYRDDYLLNLKKLTRQQNPEGFVRMMDRVHNFSFWLKSDNMNRLKLQLH